MDSLFGFVGKDFAIMVSDSIVGHSILKFKVLALIFNFL